MTMQHLMAAGNRIARRILLRADYPTVYTRDLALIALLWWHEVADDHACLEHVLSVTRFRNWKPGDGLSPFGQPFVSLHWALFVHTGDKAWVSRWVELARDFRAKVPRSFDNAVAHVYSPELGRIYVDWMQNYATWMARAGWLSGDETFFDEAASQYRLFRDALRDRQTGIWSQGRGFGPSPKFVSPIGWLRGQGWILRGMVESLTMIPARRRAHDALQELLREFATDLLRYQDKRGMWHQVPHRSDSYPETTGTGFIVHYLSRAVAQNLLPAEPFGAAARRGAEALAGFVTSDGTVLNGSYGSGPLLEMEHYLHRDAPPGDGHAPGTALLGLAGPFLTTDRRSKMALWRTVLKP